MAYKALIFGTDDIFNDLKPFYNREIQRGNLEIAAYAEIQKNSVDVTYADGKRADSNAISTFDLAIISSRKRFYPRMKQAETYGFAHNRIIDGRVFKVPNLDFPRLVKEGIAYGFPEKITVSWNECLPLNHPRVYTIKYGNNNSTLVVGQKTYISGAAVEGRGTVSLGKFCSVASGIKFRVGLNNGHDYNRISSYEVVEFEWDTPAEFRPPNGKCQINVGNDVWIGRSSVFKCSDHTKPLIIGDGAVIASDCVIVKNVPPYAIVGGNPAKIIKFRFSEDVIESLLRIKWWDWSLDKIHDNFKYFNDIDRFIALHDRS